jgi:recombination protein RecA
MLHTGSVLLNLCLSGKCDGGLPRGMYFYLVGDTSSGKTFLTLSTLAEAARDHSFDDYRLIYDDVEGGALMDLKTYFGSKLAERIEPPSGSRSRPVFSTLVEEFYFHLDDAFNAGKSFVYILDSQDALDSLYSHKKFKELKASSRTGAKSKGDYGDGKAKFHSTRIRRVIPKLRESGSILIVVNQTRDVLDSGLFGPKTQASGGRALRFYAAAQIWTSVRTRLFRTIHKKKRQIGIQAKIAVKKNRITGKEWSVNVPIYFSHGIDDIGACVEFLVDEGRWKKSKGGVIQASDFDDLEGYSDQVVAEIERSNLEEEVFDITREVFDEINQAARVERKRRYD